MVSVRQQQKRSEARGPAAAPVRRAGGPARTAPSPRYGFTPVSPRHGLAPANGLPEPLKTNMEAMSGLAMDDVRVHRNSPEPAALGALAYTQGSEIHLGTGQEQHLPHEAWHVVQQKQGRVRATLQLKGTGINDDPVLEREADAMGAKAAAGKSGMGLPMQRIAAAGGAPVIQRITMAFTDADLGHPPAVAPALEGQRVMQVVHQRDAIPNPVRAAVDAYGDNGPPPVTYKHHVAYKTTLDKLKDLCEGSTRDEIVDNMGIRCDFVGADSAGFGLDPLANVAAFNTWLDLALVAVCDWPKNIFRGPSTGGNPDHPTAPAPPALTARLAEARDVLGEID